MAEHPSPLQQPSVRTNVEKGICITVLRQRQVCVMGTRGKNPMTIIPVTHECRAHVVQLQAMCLSLYIEMAQETTSRVQLETTTQGFQAP